MQGMYLRELKLTNFRSCRDTTIELKPALTLLVGENNSGKSNVVDALRLATSPIGGRRTRYFEADDFSKGAPTDRCPARAASAGGSGWPSQLTGSRARET